MSEHQLREETAGRLLRTEVHGDNAADLEFKALDKARRCFGEDARLEVDSRYGITPSSRPEQGEFFAAIYVRCLP